MSSQDRRGLDLMDPGRQERQKCPVWFHNLMFPRQEQGANRNIQQFLPALDLPEVFAALEVIP